VILLLSTLALAGELHPNFVVRDAAGLDVLTSGLPYSPMQTCGGCHDTAYIAKHATHADAGLSFRRARGAEGLLPWETGYGRFGSWDADLYEPATPDDVADWAGSYGMDHVGGGPVAPLGVEMDCVLCHLDSANDDARRAALRAGELTVANTATLSGTGLVSLEPTETSPVTWHPEAFEDGLFPAKRLDLKDPAAERCGSCHGTVYRGTDPLERPDGRRSRTTGLVYSGQRIDESALNLVNKESLSRSWDVHAERLLECANCHHAPNHPAFRQEGDTRPAHLRFDPRKVPVGSYLRRPSHNFAIGDNATFGLTAENAMRTCEDCHDARVGHAFLPDNKRHFAALSCESCHIPRVAWTAREQLDWTALDADGSPLESWRGTDSTPDDLKALQGGYEPILLPRHEAGGRTRLAPYNLATTFVWTSGDAPVDRDALTRAWSEPAALLAAFDANHDGVLSNVERRLDTDAKMAVIAERLRASGVADPKILGFVDAYPVSHGVTGGKQVTRECTTCHGETSRLEHPLEIAAWVPGGAMPMLHGRAARALSPEDLSLTDGVLTATPPAKARRYVFGADHNDMIDKGGLMALFGALAFVVIHGGLRALSNKKQGDHR